MVTVDLITGFLGAGKTTFIHKYLGFLKDQGQSVRIIENEFGDVSVDTDLLKDEGCEIEDLAGLCMCCVGKDAFIRVLQESAETGCDRIIVEPSGIYDVDEFFEVMSLPQIAMNCEIGSILTIADPIDMEFLTEEARYLMFAQLLASGMVIMSKTQLMDEAQLTESTRQLDELMIERGCEAGLISDLCTKSWDDFDEDDFEDFMDAGYSRFVHDREIFNHSETFDSFPVIGHCRNKEDLEERIDRLFDSPSCGRVYRVKGFLKDTSGRWYEVNCTVNTHQVLPTDVNDGVIVVIGQYLQESGVKEVFAL